MMEKNVIVRAKARIEEAETIVTEADEMQAESDLMANRAIEAWETANALALRAQAQRRLATSILNMQYANAQRE